MKHHTENLSLLMDFYELTMANGYLANGLQDQVVYFDLFFRKIPDGGGFAIMAGVQSVIEYLENLHFSESDRRVIPGGIPFLSA